MVLSRALVDDEGGVSEVVGTILTLSITVVLFSSVFAAVTQLEEPTERDHIDFQGTYNEGNITIDHLGGTALDTPEAQIVVMINDKSHSFMFEDDEVTLSGKDKGVWGAGEEVTLDISSLDLTGADQLEVMVINDETNKVVWQTLMSVRAPESLPSIKETGVKYPQDWQDYVDAGDDATVYVNVEPPKNGDVDDLQVLVKLEKLKGYKDEGAWNSSYYNMTNTEGNRFEQDIKTSGEQENDTYSLELQVHNKSGNPEITKKLVEEGKRDKNASWAERGYVTINIGPPGDVTERPDIKVPDYNIRFSPASPTNGDRVTINAIVKNDGGSPASLALNFTLQPPGAGENESVVHREVSVAAGGGREKSASFQLRDSGEYNVSVSAFNISSEGGNDIPPESNNHAYETFFVQPTILIVDDDHEKNGDGEQIKNALAGADFDYNYMEVKGRQGPDFKQLNSSDIVIWATGRCRDDPDESGVLGQPTLTRDDREAIEKYLDNGNHLWLLGEGIAEDSSDWSTPSDFLDDYFGVDSLTSGTHPGSGDVVGDSILNGTSYPTNEDVTSNGDNISTSGGTKMLEDGDDTVGIHNSGSGDTYRTAFNSFQFNSLWSGHSVMAYEVIKWLGGITNKSGRDVAVSDQEFSTRTPKYQEEIEVNATIRNNGQKDENVQVRLYVNGDMYREERKNVSLDKGGDHKEVTFTWTAESVGTHDLVIKADPYDSIPETNEWNNDVRYKGIDTTVNVQFTVLIVDDDGSEDLTDDNPDFTSAVVNRTERLGYKYNRTIVSKGDIPALETLKKYNSIFWIAGEDGSCINTTSVIGGTSAVTRLKKYLDNKSEVSLFLQGERIVRDIKGDDNDFLKNYLGIDKDNLDTRSTLPSVLKGRENDPVSHGMKIGLDGSAGKDLDIVPPGKGHEMFRDENGNTLGTGYHDESNDFRTSFLSVGLRHFDSANPEGRNYDDFRNKVNTTKYAAREEFVYMTARWFGNEDERAELRVADSDIEISSSHPPVLGDSYQINAMIENVGYEDSKALVRVKEGDSLIASESMYIEGDDNGSAEINWQPTKAGTGENRRRIRVLVDPLCNADEIGNNETHNDDMGFNNLGVVETPVYYFWDDMESDSRDTWDHESTIANINGETSLDYLSENFDKTYTDIASSWSGASKNVSMTSNVSKSHPNSYALREPIVEEQTAEIDVSVPIDVVFALDTSGSMGGDPISKLKQATKDFIANLTEDDRCAIYDFHNGQLEDFAYMSDHNKTSSGDPGESNPDDEDFYNSVDNLYAQGGTPFYDTLGKAMEYSLTDDSSASNNDRLEFVIGMTDGESNEDDEWTPKANWGETIQDDTYGPDEQKEGLLKAPPMVYNIGLGIDNNNYPIAPDWSHDSPPSGDVEYDLWNVADKSNWPWGKYGRNYNKSSIGYDAMSEFDDPDPNIGHYYYAQQPSQLTNIFSQIRSIVESMSSSGGQAGTGNVTSLPPGENEIRDSQGNDEHDSDLKGVPDFKTRPTIPNNDDSQIQQTNLFSDGFESGDFSGWTDVDNPGDSGEWKVIDSSTGETDFTGNDREAAEGDFSATLRDDNGDNDYLTIENIDLSGYDHVTLDFSYHIENFGDTFGSNDVFPVEVYDGSSWTQEWSDDSTNYDDDTTSDEYVQASVDLSDYIGEEIHIRFVADSNLDWNTGLIGSDTEEVALDDVSVTGFIGPTITVTQPNGGESWEAGTDHDITWTTTAGDNPIDHVELLYSTDGGSNWNTIEANTADDGVYTWTVPNDLSTDCYVGARVYDTIGVTDSDMSDSSFDINKGVPYVKEAYPSSGDTALPSQYVTVIFDQRMNTNNDPDLTQIQGTDPGNWELEYWSTTYTEDDTATWSHDNWTYGESVTLNVSNFESHYGVPGDSYEWTFEILEVSTDQPIFAGGNSNKTAITPTLDLTGLSSARLSFWNKYNIVPGTNGGFLEVGYKDGTEWKWNYTTPARGSYSGNLETEVDRFDDFGNEILYAWNGVSGGGTFDWEYVQVDLLKYLPEDETIRDDVRIKFNYTQYGGGTGYGWYFDGVKVKVSRDGDEASNIDGDMKDVWQKVSTTDETGEDTTAWWNGYVDSSSGNKKLKGGIDNSLISSPIDLTNAKTAELNADFMFNLNTKAGAPPDGFRVEVSTDNGVTWSPINLGARTASGVSGDPSDSSTPQWVEAGSLDRLMVDLSDFSGETILIRFRMVTNNVQDHFAVDSQPKGFYVDNVIIEGVTT